VGRDPVEAAKQAGQIDTKVFAVEIRRFVEALENVALPLQRDVGGFGLEAGLQEGLSAGSGSASATVRRHQPAWQRQVGIPTGCGLPSWQDRALPRDLHTRMSAT
jgi:hypothetical protein